MPGGAATNPPATENTLTDPAVDRIPLPPVADSVSSARRWLRDRLSGWPPDASEAAVLALSELVTNVVLHARTAMEVVFEAWEGRMRVEVLDHSLALPVPKAYGPDASTGRGLRLVEALSDSWGVREAPGGKSVWFEMSEVASPDGDPDPVEGWIDLDDFPDLEEAAPDVGILSGLPGPMSAYEMIPVRILSVPIDIYLEAENHNDALMREFSLIAADRSNDSVPARLLELGGEVRRRFGGSTLESRSQVDDALADGRVTVDLTITVPRVAWDVLTRLSEMLDEADRFCEAGDMLTLSSSPRVRNFRRWYQQQVLDQVSGLTPTPWSDQDGAGGGPGS